MFLSKVTFDVLFEIKFSPGCFLFPDSRQVVCWSGVFCIPGFLVDLIPGNRYSRLFVGPDAVVGYLGPTLGGLPNTGLYSGVSGFFLVRGYGDRYYWLRSYCILV